MSAIRALTLARSAGVEVELSGDTIELTAPVEPPAEVIAELMQHKADIVSVLKRRRIELPPSSLFLRVARARGITSINGKWHIAYLPNGTDQALIDDLTAAGWLVENREAAERYAADTMRRARLAAPRVDDDAEWMGETNR